MPAIMSPNPEGSLLEHEVVSNMFFGYIKNISNRPLLIQKGICFSPQKTMN
jgi:hypothetical protein